MAHVVITGGTRGIGFGMVKEFLARGFKVTFCGTSDSSVMKAMDTLAGLISSKSYRGVVCDISEKDDLVNLWDFASKIFGEVNIWINNAGISNTRCTFNELSIDEINRLIDVNIKGLVNSTHFAYNRMLAQGKGFIYNMGGLGSRGRMVKGLAPYGTSKRAVEYFTKAFARELDSRASVKVGFLLPGMVLTDMLLDPLKEGSDDARQLKRLYNLLADEVEPVASYLVEKIIENNRNGAVISYSSSLKMFMRIPGRLFTGRDIVTDKLSD